MKKLFIIITCISLIICKVEAKNLKALFSYNLFYITENNTPYLETYLSINSSTVKFHKNSNGNYQATLIITMALKQNDKVINYNKYNLKSIETIDSIWVSDIFDLQRLSIPNGDYDFELTIKDSLASEENQFSYSEKISVNFQNNKTQMSNITMVDTLFATTTPNILSKNGVDIFPRILNFYPEVYNRITVYAEIYNLNKHFTPEERFIVRTTINDANNLKVVNPYILNKKDTPKATNIVISEFNIESLRSGNYYIEIKVLNRKEEEIISQKLYFQRSNNIKMDLNYYSSINIAYSFAGQIKDIDTLTEYVRCLSPISSISEKQTAQNFLSLKNLDLLQKYFYDFWYKRNNNNPEQEWTTYLKNVQVVNSKYSSKIYRGYETDMGRVFLQYGKPNSIASNNNEPSALPYQIWHYYSIGNYTNKRFVFYTPFIASNDYVLLHSDMVGEPNDPKWRLRIYSRNNPAGDAENTQVEDHFGKKADDYFDTPR